MSALEEALKSNTQWPYKIEGVLDITDAGGYGEDNDYPDWAVGVLIIEELDDELMIDIGQGVVRDARIDIDSGEKITAWLAEPTEEDGMLTYSIMKLGTA